MWVWVLRLFEMSDEKPKKCKAIKAIVDHMGGAIFTRFPASTSMSTGPPPPILTFTDRQQRILAVLREIKYNMRSNTPFPLREMAQRHEISYGFLQRATKHETSKTPIRTASHGRGRRQRLTQEEEKLVCDAVIEFMEKGTPLDRDCIRD